MIAVEAFSSWCGLPRSRLRRDGHPGPLSRRAGPAGRVVGLTPDPQQVAAAWRYVQERGLANVEVLEGDPFTTALPRAAFDLVHARFRLAPAGRDRELVREMVGLSRPGGVVAVQEPDASLLRCYPPRPAWDRLTQAITAAAAAAGADLTAGQRTYRLFRRAGLDDVRVRAALVALHDAHPVMRLPIILAEALRPQIVEIGLLAEVELDAALRECEQAALDADTFVTTFLVAQVWGRRASTE